MSLTDDVSLAFNKNMLMSWWCQYFGYWKSLLHNLAPWCVI